MISSPIFAMRKKLKRHRKFERNFRKRITADAKLVKQFERRLSQYLAGVRGTPINDHPLTGRLAGFRAFSVGGDIRVIYIETDAEIIFLDIGSHNQVYGDYFVTPDRLR